MMVKKIQKQPLKAKYRKFHTYSTEAIEATLRDIKSGTSIREASRRYGVPRATVHDKLCGKSPAIKKKTGPPPILSENGENKIAEWAINIAKCGFPITKSDLIEAVTKIANDAGKLDAFPNGVPGVRWYKGFLKRHPEISQREAEGINKARALITEELIRTWFKNLETHIQENNVQDIFEDPTRVFNGDESGFSLCPKTGKVLGPKGWKNLYTIKSGKEKENITVLIVFNAAGKICPPLVVFPYIRPPRALVENVPEDWVIGKSESGWMTGNVFYEYVVNQFNAWVTKNKIKRPIILFIDGHKSHMTLPLSQFCEQNGIILYALPPNTTHILQPADVSVFRPMKHEWRKTVKDWQNRPKNINQIITKINFCNVFKEALQNTQMENHIVKGFRKCGLYPLNADNVDFTKCVKNILEKQHQNQSTTNAEHLTARDFDSAEKVINSIQTELEKYGINSDVIINEINMARKSLVTVYDALQNSTPASVSTTNTLQQFDVIENSIIPMDAVTLLPIHIIEIEENVILENFVKDDSEPQGQELKIPNTGFITREENKTPNKLYEQSIMIKQNNQKPIFCTINYDNTEKNTLPKSTKVSKIDNKNLESNAYNEKDCKDKTREGEELMSKTILLETNMPSSIQENDDNSNLPQQTQDKENVILAEKVTDNIANENINSFTVLEEEKAIAIQKNDIENLTHTNRNNGILVDKLANSTSILIQKNEILSFESKNKMTPIGKLDPFQKHLTYPEEYLKKKTDGRTKLKLPSAISSEAWRSYYNQKDAEKKEKMEVAKSKRKIREQLKIQKQEKSKKKTKSITKKVSKKNNDSKTERKNNNEKKVQCALCLEDLVSDIEEDKEKNIGCDECPRWYHLKCTDMEELPYNEAARKDYICDLCR